MKTIGLLATVLHIVSLWLGGFHKTRQPAKGKGTESSWLPRNQCASSYLWLHVLSTRVTIGKLFYTSSKRGRRFWWPASTFSECLYPAHWCIAARQGNYKRYREINHTAEGRSYWSAALKSNKPARNTNGRNRPHHRDLAAAKVVLTGYRLAAKQTKAKYEWTE